MTLRHCTAALCYRSWYRSMQQYIGGDKPILATCILYIFSSDVVRIISLHGAAGVMMSQTMCARHRVWKGRKGSAHAGCQVQQLVGYGPDWAGVQQPSLAGWIRSRCHSNSEVPSFRYPHATYPRIICTPIQHILKIYGLPNGTPWVILNPFLAPCRSLRVEVKDGP